MKKRALCLVLLAAMILSLAACGNSKAPGSTPTDPPSQPGTTTPDNNEAPNMDEIDTSDWITLDLSYATYLPAENPIGNLFSSNTQGKLDELMPGYVNITLYPSGTLLAQADIFEGVISGVADIGVVDVSSVSELCPVTALWASPATHVSATSSATAALNEWLTLQQPKELEEVIVLAAQCNTAGQMVTSFDWNSISELKGKQIRATAAHADTVTALGATPVSIATSELYEAARSGLIDGAYYTITANYLQGSHEFMKYGVFTNMSASPYLYVMNRNVFESMPESQQQVFMEAMRQAVWEEVIPMIPVMGDVHEPCLREIEKGAYTVKALPDETYEEMFAAVAPLRDAYIADIESKGYSEASEAAALIDQLTEKWNQWFSYEDYQEPFYMAMDGKLDEYLAKLENLELNPYPEINGYIPLADR